MIIAVPEVYEEGRWRVLAGGAKATIHVHQQKIKKGEAAIIVRRRGKSVHCSAIQVSGLTRFVQTPEPDSCGARVTAVTWDDVYVKEGWDESPPS
jgi:hypothetical protein